MRRLFSLCLLLILLSIGLAGQHYSPGMQQADPDWLEQFLYNGVEWRPGYPLVTGHQFFLTKEYVNAEITIDGLRFSDLRIRYDICNDDVILLWKNIFPIVLRMDRIDEFTIRHEGTARRFVNFRNALPEFRGFAEVLYDGSSTFMARHTKAVSINSSQSSYAQFREYTRYYFLVNGTCRQVRNRGSFLNMMGEYETDVRRFIRQNNIIISSLSPAGFGVAAAYYDSLVAKEDKE